MIELTNTRKYLVFATLFGKNSQLTDILLYVEFNGGYVLGYKLTLEGGYISIQTLAFIETNWIFKPLGFSILLFAPRIGITEYLKNENPYFDYIPLKYEQKLGLLIAAPMLVELMLLGTVLQDRALTYRSLKSLAHDKILVTASNQLDSVSRVHSTFNTFLRIFTYFGLLITSKILYRQTIHKFIY